jgi:hypothetical protein
MVSFIGCLLGRTLEAARIRQSAEILRFAQDDKNGDELTTDGQRPTTCFS